MKKLQGFWHDTGGYAVVEATILFPLMIMIFAALVVLAKYLPTRAALQRATQYAAIALATELSDTWLFFDESSLSYYWQNDERYLNNVYASLAEPLSPSLAGDRSEAIIANIEKNGVITPLGTLSVACTIADHIIYKEIIIMATRTIPNPVNLSLINFPQEISLTVSATALVQNGDEFARNMDLALDCFTSADARYRTTAGGLLAKAQEVIEQISALAGK